MALREVTRTAPVTWRFVRAGRGAADDGRAHLFLLLARAPRFCTRPLKPASSRGPRNHIPRTHELYPVELPQLSFHHDEGQGQPEFSKWETSPYLLVEELQVDSTHVSLSKCWETVKDREAWRAAVRGVSKSQTRPSN